MSVLVFAEPGACHDGDLAKAQRLIELAAEAGADVIKWQWWSDPDRLAERRRAGDTYRAIYRRYRMPQAWLFTLLAHARGRIDTACTCYLPDDAAVLAPYVSWLKVASFERGAEDVLEACAATGKPLLVSTGMTDEAELSRLVRTLDGLRADYRLLHCVSSYPAPSEELNLSVLSRPQVHGFSDHSDPAETWTGALAVAAGADVVEAHIRLDTTDPQNPDAPHAMSAEQFTGYVRHVRYADALLGTGVKMRLPSEAAMARFQVA